MGVGHRGRHVVVINFTARDEVARRPAELDVDYEIEDEVDGEVDEQQEVGDCCGDVEGAIIARAAGHSNDEVEEVGWRDEECEKNDKRYEGWRYTMSRIDRLLIGSVQRLQ